jgi:hypothetical protein
MTQLPSSEYMDEDTVKILTKCTAVSDEFLVEIGRITAHFALLERDLIELNHILLGLPENMARTITSELSFRSLQQLAASLLRERLPTRHEELGSILKKVAKCEEKRNWIVHSLWGSGAQTQEGAFTVIRTKYSAKQHKGLSFTREVLTAKDLRRISEEISVAAYDVEAFSYSIREKSS